MTLLVRPVLLAIAAILSCSSVQAAIQIGTAAGFGAGSLTIDTDTGLEWLDWTESVGISYNDMITQFGVGDTYEGWRHATRAEVGVLFASLGLPVGAFPDGSVIQDGGSIAFSALGIVGFTGGPNYRTTGITADSQDRLFQFVADIYTIPGDTFTEYSGAAANRSVHVDSIQDIVGHALVRDSMIQSVPEASSVFCWLGLVGLGLIGYDWKSHRHQ